MGYQAGEATQGELLRTYMKPIVTDGIAWSVVRSVCLSVTIVSPTRMTEPIGMQFGTMMGWPKEAYVKWRNLANTIEPSMCGRDAPSLSNYFDHLFFQSW